jgi:hypothetical protein
MSAASLHRLPSGPKLDYPLGMARKLEWAVVVAGLSCAVPLWRARDPGASPGDVVEEPITLVPEDRDKLACMLDHPISGYSCAYRAPGEPTDPPPPAKNVIVPCMTIERTLYLVAGLFEDPAVSRRVSSGYGYRRFTARCKLRLVELVTGYELRFANDAPWGREGPAWLVEPVSCVTE